MDFDEYSEKGKEMVDYIANYLKNIRNRSVYPTVQPGYLQSLIPEFAPIDAEEWEVIFQDIERCIMPGVTHWQSPHMHGYFPALNSFPSLLGDMLADAINCLGFTWASSPVVTELEIVVTNWLGKMIGLPKQFLHNSSNSCEGGGGGGVIQTTASESTLICLLAGRTETIGRYKAFDDGVVDAEINSLLVAYCSDQAHSSVEKAGLIGLVKLHYIESDENYSMRVDKLVEAIEMDKTKGLIPFFVCATLGTTAGCAFDNLELIGKSCETEKLWIHVDAAYAGSSFVCPEYRSWLKGVQYVHSFAFNPSKWLLVNFDCTALWVKDCAALHRTFNVQPLYLKHENTGHAIDYMHWQIPLSKRFRALKLWFVIRRYGIRGLQDHVRKGVKLAQKFESLVRKDDRFIIPATRYLGLVVFSLRDGNVFTEMLLKTLNSRCKIHCVPATLKDIYVIRFTVTSQYTTDDDILDDWKEIQLCADIVLSPRSRKSDVANFGTSLLLSNTPMSPKVVDGSYAGIFEKEHALSPWKRWVEKLYDDMTKNQVKQICVRGKQYSLDSQLNVVHNMFFKRNTLMLKGAQPNFPDDKKKRRSVAKSESSSADNNHNSH